MRSFWIRSVVLGVVLGIGLGVGSAVRAQEEGEPSLLELSKQAAEAAHQGYENASKGVVVGTGSVEDVALWSERVAKWDELSRKATGAEAANGHHERMTRLEADTKKLVDMGSASAADLNAATFHRIHAQLSARAAAGR